jgi:hypothetical protein
MIGAISALCVKGGLASLGPVILGDKAGAYELDIRDPIAAQPSPAEAP